MFQSLLLKGSEIILLKTPFLLDIPSKINVSKYTNSITPLLTAT